MFIYKDFKKILDTTTELIKQIKTSKEDDAEEIQMRIDSNVHALKIMATKMEDQETRNTFLKSIQSLTTSNILPEEGTYRRQRHTNQPVENNELIDEELLKNARRLKEMASQFKNSLDEDKKIVAKLVGKMGRGSEESGRSLKLLTQSGPTIRSSTFLTVTLIIFVVMYFLTRFW